MHRKFGWHAYSIVNAGGRIAKVSSLVVDDIADGRFYTACFVLAQCYQQAVCNCHVTAGIGSQTADDGGSRGSVYPCALQQMP